MRGIINDKNIIVIEVENIIHLDLPKDLLNKVKHEIDFIMKQKFFSAVHTTKKNLFDYCRNILSIIVQI